MSKDSSLEGKCLLRCVLADLFFHASVNAAPGQQATADILAKNKVLTLML